MSDVVIMKTVAKCTSTQGVLHIEKAEDGSFYTIYNETKGTGGEKLSADDIIAFLAAIIHTP